LLSKLFYWGTKVSFGILFYGINTKSLRYFIKLFFLNDKKNLLKEREKFAPKKHLNETVEEMRKFNSKRRLKVILILNNFFRKNKKF
jgi:hypothetical protein